AQAMGVLALPLLTRLYTPNDFDVWAVYAGLLMVLAPAACLRLDVAIPMPEDDDDAMNLLVLALGSAAVLSAVTATVVVAMPGQIARVTNQPELRSHLWLLPVGIAAAGGYSAFQHWGTRQRA